MIQKKVYKNIIELVLSWSSTAGHRSHTSVWLIHPGRLPLGKLSFPLQAVVNQRWLLTQGLQPCPLPPPRDGTQAGLSLCRPVSGGAQSLISRVSGRHRCPTVMGPLWFLQPFCLLVLTGSLSPERSPQPLCPHESILLMVAREIFPKCVSGNCCASVISTFRPSVLCPAALPPCPLPSVQENP